MPPYDYDPHAEKSDPTHAGHGDQLAGVQAATTPLTTPDRPESHLPEARQSLTIELDHLDRLVGEYLPRVVKELSPALRPEPPREDAPVPASRSLPPDVSPLAEVTYRDAERIRLAARILEATLHDIEHRLDL